MIKTLVKASTQSLPPVIYGRDYVVLVMCFKYMCDVRHQCQYIANYSFYANLARQNHPIFTTASLCSIDVWSWSCLGQLQACNVLSRPWLDVGRGFNIQIVASFFLGDQSRGGFFVPPYHQVSDPSQVHKYSQEAEDSRKYSGYNTHPAV